MKKSFEKVAIVYDWADTNYGGAEKVLLTLKKIYPEATLFVPLADFARAKWLKSFAKVETSWLQNFPNFIKKNRPLCTLFLPLAIESFNFDDFDLIISVSSFVAKGVLTKPHQTHLCYLLTPTRFLYSHQKKYFAGKKLLYFLATPALKYLRTWDKVAASRPDYIVPISNLIARRVEKYYGRKTWPVIYPPFLETVKSSVASVQKGDYYLAVGRLVAYKKMDVAVAACLQAGVKLKVVGVGEQLKKLQSMVKRNHGEKLVEFLGNVSNEQLQKLYSEAKAVLMIGEEDFGIVALEANAAGTIVIGNKNSGALEILPPAAKIELPKSTLTGTIYAIQVVKKRADLTASRVAKKYDQSHFMDNWQKML